MSYGTTHSLVNILKDIGLLIGLRYLGLKGNHLEVSKYFTQTPSGLQTLYSHLISRTLFIVVKLPNKVSSGQRQPPSSSDLET